MQNGHSTGTTLDPEGPLSDSGDGTCNREWHDKKPIRRNTAHVKPPCRLGIQSGIVALDEQRKQYGRWLPIARSCSCDRRLRAAGQVSRP